MTIAEKNTRLVVTVPKFEADAFRKDADDLGMTLSRYVYLVLTSWSDNVPESYREYANDCLELAQEIPAQRESFDLFRKAHPRES